MFSNLFITEEILNDNRIERKSGGLIQTELCKQIKEAHGDVESRTRWDEWGLSRRSWKWSRILHGRVNFGTVHKITQGASSSWPHSLVERRRITNKQHTESDVISRIKRPARYRARRAAPCRLGIEFNSTRNKKYINKNKIAAHKWPHGDQRPQQFLLIVTSAITARQ